MICNGKGWPLTFVYFCRIWIHPFSLVCLYYLTIADLSLIDNLPKRIENINNYFTFSLYSNVCRSLFEKDKLMFAFLLCTRIQAHQGLIAPVSTSAPRSHHPYFCLHCHIPWNGGVTSLFHWSFRSVNKPSANRHILFTTHRPIPFVGMIFQAN